MKKILTIVVLCMCTAVVFAGPHHGRGGHHRGGHHGHYRGNDGVWLAAGITNIVANGIQILNGIAYPRTTVVATPAPVYQQPVVVPQPVYQQPVYVQPQPVVPQPAPAVYYPPQPVYTQPVYRYPAPAPRPVYYRNVYIEKGYAPVIY